MIFYSTEIDNGYITKIRILGQNIARLEVVVDNIFAMKIYQTRRNLEYNRLAKLAVANLSTLQSFLE